ncbi:MAG: asparagine synthase (glutamine-hydrolyzing) [Candidatus Riflebacteria bacterium]|nr:asparagine synthase (glutamine-hydrolyzing) [Candidatus Riflebacteria bacterium]
MSGIAGILSTEGTPAALKADLVKMATALAHRGRDGDGVWMDEAGGAGLAHRLLATSRIGPETLQPVASPGGRWLVALDGELLNHLSLRKQLDGVTWRGPSDAETLAALLEAWGPAATAPKLAGQFAFAAWDSRERVLALARDPAGTRPMAVATLERSFLFASDVRALESHPAFSFEVDRGSLALLLRLGYIPAPRSILAKVRRVPAGTLVTVKAREAGGFAVAEQQFWSMRLVAEQSSRRLLQIGEAEIVDALDALLKDVVRAQSTAGIPLGVLLSGGVGSSILAAMMQSQSQQPIKSYSVVFRDDEEDESHQARIVAANAGTDHTEIIFGERECLDLVQRLPDVYDEPLGDFSTIPTLLVAEYARRHVTLALSGEGGDEVFGGHSRYYLERLIWRAITLLSPVMRQAIIRLLLAVPPPRWNGWLQATRSVWPEPFTRGSAGERVYKLAAILLAQKEEALYHLLVSHWLDSARVVLGATEPATAYDDPSLWPDVPEFPQHMMALDAATYLPDCVLVRHDRAGAAAGLEVRTPLLDPRVLEFGLRIPPGVNLQDRRGKHVLRRLLDRYAPPKLFRKARPERRIPVAQWLRGQLKDWALGLINESRLNREGFFDAKQVVQKWQEHFSGARDWHRQLWNVLMFQAWFDRRQRG